MKQYVAEVIYYPEEKISPGPVTEHLVIADHCMADAVDNLMEYYGEEYVETVKITMLNAEDSKLRITPQTYEDLIKNGEC